MSDCDSDLVRVSSVESTKESFDVVPKDQDYKLKLFDMAGNLLEKVAYTLRKGKKLPFTRDLQGRSSKM